MKIHCPACNAEYEVEESAVGRRVQCECGHKWEIQPEKMKTQCPKCKIIFETEEKAVGQWVKCPECGGEWCVLSAEEEKRLIEAEKQNAAIEEKQKNKSETGKNNLFIDFLLLIKAIIILLLTCSIIIGIPAGLIFLCFRSCSSISSAKSLSSEKIDAWVYTQYLVEAHLKSPRSAKFEFGGSERVQKTGSDIFIVRSYVDAKNSFGTDIRQYFFCKLQRKPDGKFEVLQLTFE